MKYYKDKNGRIVTVAEAYDPQTYTFYRLPENNLKGRGQRVRTRPMQYFTSMAEGFAALEIFAKQKGWAFLGSDLPCKSPERKRDNRTPLFDWQPGVSRQSEIKAVSDVLYQKYKDEVVRASVLCARTELVGYRRPETLAFQIGMTNVGKSGMFSDDEVRTLEHRLASPTLGGVFARIVAELKEPLSSKGQTLLPGLEMAA